MVEGWKEMNFVDQSCITCLNSFKSLQLHEMQHEFSNEHFYLIAITYNTVDNIS